MEDSLYGGQASDDKDMDRNVPQGVAQAFAG